MQKMKPITEVKRIKLVESLNGVHGDVIMNDSTDVVTNDI